MAKSTGNVHDFVLVVPESTPLHFRAAETRGNNTRIEAELNTDPPGADSVQVCVWGPALGVLEGDVPTPLAFGDRPRLSIRYHIDRMPDASGEFAAECLFTSGPKKSNADSCPGSEDEDSAVPKIGGRPFVVAGSFSDGTEIVCMEVRLVQGGGS